jgi:hypothetical protein
MLLRPYRHGKPPWFVTAMQTFAKLAMPRVTLNGPQSPQAGEICLTPQS